MQEDNNLFFQLSIKYFLIRKIYLNPTNQKSILKVFIVFVWWWRSLHIKQIVLKNTNLNH